MDEFPKNENMEAEEIPKEIREWLKDRLSDYQEFFDFSEEDLRSKKILEIGAGDRRFAAACLVEGISNQIYSLEPALSGSDKESYASQDAISGLVEKLPENLQNEINTKTVVAEAEKIPLQDQSFDIVFGKSIPFESSEKLCSQIKESLRVAKEVRLFPITPEKRKGVEKAVEQVNREIPIKVDFQLIREIEFGNKKITEELLKITNIQDS